MRETAEGQQTVATPRAVWVAAGVLVAVLVACAHRYGFHRDELYFIEGGHHPAVGQPDNPMGIPLLARWWSDLVGGRLWAFRILPALASGVTVLVAAWTCKAFGGSRMAQIITAVATASMSIVLGTGHLFSTTTFDLTLTSAAVLLLVRALQEPSRLGRWCALGVVVGVAMEVKILPAVLLSTCLVGLLVLGPRKPLLKPGPYLAGVIALVLAAPYLFWQATRDWPMLTVAANIAEGGSVSSASRILVIPLSLVMIGPLLCVVAILGVVTSLRAGERGRWGWIGLGYLCLLVFVVVTGGKPYYLAGYFPALLALGSRPLASWLSRSRRRTYGWWTAVAVFAVPTAVFSLPLAPVGSTAFQVAASVNPDGAETVGWPSYVATVRQVADGLDAGQRSRTVIITDNYGEAGALTRVRRSNPAGAAALPPVYSGHNAFGDWGLPPESADTAIMLGDFDPEALRTWFTSCAVVAELTSPPGVDNEEDGAPLRLCTGPTQPWPALWPTMRHLG